MIDNATLAAVASAEVTVTIAIGIVVARTREKLAKLEEQLRQIEKRLNGKS